MPITVYALWIALMLTYLFGGCAADHSGDITAGRMGNMQFTQGMWLGIAILMLIPIVMVLLSLILHQPINRWVSIIIASFFFLFNLVGLPT